MDNFTFTRFCLRLSYVVTQKKLQWIHLADRDSFVFTPPVASYGKDIQVWCFIKVTACGLGPLENSEQASEYKNIQSFKAGTVLLGT